jgi:hypothetical protein
MYSAPLRQLNRVIGTDGRRKAEIISWPRSPESNSAVEALQSKYCDALELLENGQS